jgi:ABC-2 type transport system permease protein
VLDLSPFTHVPNAPAASVDAVPLVVLSAVALALGGLGLAAFRRRDLAM